MTEKSQRGEIPRNVREVWHLVRGDQPFYGHPEPRMQQYRATSHRPTGVSFGKGEKQTDVDFVIQPYREFLRLNTLTFHTQASPDKVFECLVERGPFWQNVLQFYVAVAAPAQQIAWVQRALQRDCGECDYRGFDQRSRIPESDARNAPRIWSIFPCPVPACCQGRTA